MIVTQIHAIMGDHVQILSMGIHVTAVMPGWVRLAQRHMMHVHSRHAGMVPTAPQPNHPDNIAVHVLPDLKALTVRRILMIAGLTPAHGHLNALTWSIIIPVHVLQVCVIRFFFNLICDSERLHLMQMYLLFCNFLSNDIN